MKWTASDMGKKGGRATSATKRATALANLKRAWASSKRKRKKANKYAP